QDHGQPAGPPGAGCHPQGRPRQRGVMIRRRRLSVLGALLVAGLAVSASAAGPDWGALDLQPYESPKPAPAFSLPDLAGHTRNLAELRGKVVLLFFWATW